MKRLLFLFLLYPVLLVGQTNIRAGTVTVTNTGVFTNTQMNMPFVSNINNLNFQAEYQNANSANHYSTDGFAAGVNAPANSSAFTVNGVSGYVVANGGTTHAWIAGNFIANAKANNTNTFGANIVAEDIPGLTATVTLTAAEFDTGPQNATSAYNGAFGITSVIGGTNTVWTPGTTIGGSAAFSAGTNAIAANRAWNYGFWTQDQSVIPSGYAFLAGSTCGVGSCASQQLGFNSRISGTDQASVILADAAGVLFLSPFGGSVRVNGQLFSPEQAAPSLLGSNTDQLWADNSHRWRMSNNGASGTNVAGFSDFTVTLKKGSGAGDYNGTNTSYSNIDGTNLSFTVTIPTGSKLVIQSSGTMRVNTSAVNVNIALADGGVVLQEIQGLPPTAGTSTIPFSLSWTVTGDGASHTITLQAKTANASDAWVVENSSSTLLPTMAFSLMPSN